MFDPNVIAARYEKVLAAAADGRRCSMEHWFPIVPESAYRLLT
jgi:hypothetical protein